MDWSIILKAVLALGASGLILGVALAFAAKRFHVEVDPKVERIHEVLPGANCGACGHPGCFAAAEAMAEGKAAAHTCTAGGHGVAHQIATILGVTVSELPVPVKVVAACSGGRNKSALRYAYDNMNDCDSANLLAGGPLACDYGCLGYGNCVRSCAFDALKMDDALPLRDTDKCTGCGACIGACPKNIMMLVPASAPVYVACNSNAKGKVVRSICEFGCIACKKCERVCEPGAITVVDNLAVVDYGKCDGCLKCVSECPTGCIREVYEAVAEEEEMEVRATPA